MNLSKNEMSLLLYFETQAVDYGGTLESVRMNADDFAIAKRWSESGFVRFGRIAFHDIKRHNGIARDHWCVLSEEAWVAAHAERRARNARVEATLKVRRIGIDDQDADEPEPALDEVAT